MQFSQRLINLAGFSTPSKSILTMQTKVSFGRQNKDPGIGQKVWAPQTQPQCSEVAKTMMIVPREILSSLCHCEKKLDHREKIKFYCIDSPIHNR